MGIYTEITIKVDSGYEISVLEELIQQLKNNGIHDAKIEDANCIVEVETEKRW